MPSWLTLWKEIADAVSSTATALAIVAAAIWFFRQRLRHPRANIQLDVEHWTAGGRYLLRARVRLANGGTVAIQGRSLLVRVQQVIPLVPDIEQKFASDADPVAAGDTEILWPELGCRECNWSRGERLVEPGETDENHFEFVVPNGVDLVQVYAYFTNSSRWPWQRTLGWHVTVAHSLEAGGSGDKGKLKTNRSPGASEETAATTATAAQGEGMIAAMANERREDNMAGRPPDRSTCEPETVRQATPKPVPPPAPRPKPPTGGGAGKKPG